MPESSAFARRGIKGGCALAHIPGGLAAGVTGVVACDDLSTWSGLTTNGPARVMVNREGAAPEEIEISSVSGNNITIAARGVGNTSDTTHSANATIEVVSSPRDFDEANKAASETVGKVTAAGDLIYASGANAFARLAKGTARQVLGMNAAANAPEWQDSPQSLLTAQGDLLYASAANVLARLAKGTARQVLQMNAGATAPEWAASPQSLLTATGDLLYASAANTLARLAVGAEGRLLSINSSGVPAWAGFLSAAVRKSADESATSDATVNNDTHLVLPVIANEVAMFEAVLFVGGSNVSDIKVTFDGPAGCTIAFGGYGPPQGTTPSSTVTADLQVAGNLAEATELAFGLESTSAFVTIILRGLIVNGANAGNLTLQWAQAASGATATTVKANSHMWKQRIA